MLYLFCDLLRSWFNIDLDLVCLPFARFVDRFELAELSLSLLGLKGVSEVNHCPSIFRGVFPNGSMKYFCLLFEVFFLLVFIVSDFPISLAENFKKMRHPTLDMATIIVVISTARKK